MSLLYILTGMRKDVVVRVFLSVGLQPLRLQEDRYNLVKRKGGQFAG
jgi:hypothetical protein